MRLKMKVKIRKIFLESKVQILERHADLIPALTRFVLYSILVKELRNYYRIVSTNWSYSSYLVLNIFKFSIGKFRVKITIF